MKKRVLSTLLAGVIAVSSIFSASAAGTPTDIVAPPTAVETAPVVTSTTEVTAAVTEAVTAAIAVVEAEIKAIVAEIAAVVASTGVSVTEAAKTAGVAVPTASKPVEVVIEIKNVAQVEKAQLQAIVDATAKAATEAGVTAAAVKPVLDVKITDKSGEVIAEIKVDVKAALAVGGTVKTGVVLDSSGKTFGAAATAVSKVIDTAAAANVKQVSFEQRDNFPTRTEVAVKASTFGFSASTNLTALNYYSYQPASNKLIKLNVKTLAPKISNGMLVLNTKYAGDLIITPTPLGKK